MNRAQHALCQVTNGALTGAILFITFVPFPNPDHTYPELVTESTSQEDH